MFFLVFLFIGCFSDPEMPPVLTDNFGLLNEGEQNALQKQLGDISSQGEYSLLVHIVFMDDSNNLRRHRNLVISEIPEKKWTRTVLIYMVYGDRTIDIKTGPEIMYKLTDSMCMYAIKRMTHFFKSGKYYQGLSDGVNVIDSMVKE